jgi:hypothetical protein
MDPLLPGIRVNRQEDLDMANSNDEISGVFDPKDLEIDANGNLVFKNLTPETKKKLEDVIEKNKAMQPGQAAAGTLKVTAIT